MVPDSSPTEEIRRFEEQYRSQPESLVFARLADAYRRSGRLDEALEVLDGGLVRHPDYPAGHVVRGRTLQDLGREDEALVAFRRVLELDAQNLVAVRELARSAEQRGDVAEARHWYERIVQADPLGEEAIGRLAALQAELESAQTGTREKVRDEAESDTARAGVPWWERVADAEPPGEATARDSGEPAEASPHEPASPEDGPEITSGEEAIEAILNGEVPQTIRAEDTWWYEDQPRQDAKEPSRDADLLTRTMADLYAEQGLYREAADIYEELLRDSPEDESLAERLADVQARARSRTGTRASGMSEPGTPGVPEAAAQPLDIPAHLEAAEGGSPPSIGRAAGMPVADELRRILRLGEERAGALSEPPPPHETPHEASSDEPDPGAAPHPVADDAGTPEPTPERSEFASEWLRSLERGA